MRDKGLDRKQAGVLLGVSFKTIEKFENGRTILTRPKSHKFFLGMIFPGKILRRALMGKVNKSNLDLSQKKNQRSLPTIICGEVTKNHYQRGKTLTVLRQLKGLNKYQASRECGYPKCTIGHIENGRIEMSPNGFVTSLNPMDSP